MPKFRVKFVRDGENRFDDVDAPNPTEAADKVRKLERSLGNSIQVLTTKLLKTATA